MTTTMHRALPFVAPLFLVFVAPADDIRYEPKPGTEVAKKLDVTLELSVDDITVEANGQPLPPEVLGEVQDMSLSLALALGVTEKLVGAKDGQPTDLLRTYDSMKVKAEAGDNSSDEAIEKLEGKTVHFVWDEKKGAYEKSWHECSGEDEILNPLSADMDVRALLPGKKVAKGDKWEISGTKVLSLFLPGVQGGNVDLGKSGMGEKESKAAQIVLDELGTQFEEAAKQLKVVCEYAGTHDAEGVNVADVHLHLDGDITLNLGSMIERIAEEMQDAGPQPKIKATLSLKMKGDGSLLWNTATNMLHSYELDSDVDLKAEIDADAEEGGQEMKFHASLGLGGKGSWKLSSTKP